MKRPQQRCPVMSSQAKHPWF